MTFPFLRRSITAVLTGVVPVIVAVLATSTPSAQSLGDLAASEAKRRQAVGAGKRYTAEDLPADSGSITSPASPVASTEVPQPAAAGDGEPAAAQGGGTPPPKDLRDEKYWRARANEIRTKMEQIQSRIRALGGRLQDLGGEDGHAASERAVSQRALDHARQDAESMKGEWDRFEARARLSKIPADWLQ